jgi:hypothetical protein
MKKVLLAAIVAAFFASVVLAQTTYPIQITKVETKDARGNLRTSFRRGEVIVVETEIAYPTAYYYYYAGGASYTYLLIIEMWYRSTMMGLTLTRGTIAPGETKTFGGGIATRVGDPAGTYTFDIYVWNGFPSEMGNNWAPLADPKTASVTVTP